MKTIKEVSKLTGVSIRALQYYDKIGLLKPTNKTDSNYRLYDDEAISKLQQILFFKELDFKLKDIKIIMEDPNFDKIQAYKKQKKLLSEKNKRISKLIKILEKLEKGEKCMEFNEFDLSDYFEALEEFKDDNKDEVIKNWGSIQNYNDTINKMKEHEKGIAESAIKWYGSIEKYTEKMKDNLEHFSERMKKVEELKESGLIEKNEELSKLMLADLTKDVKGKEIQDIVREIVKLTDQISELTNTPLPHNYWEALIEYYLNNEVTIQNFDKIHGIGSSQFIGKALQYYFMSNQTK